MTAASDVPAARRERKLSGATYATYATYDIDGGEQLVSG